MTPPSGVKISRCNTMTIAAPWVSVSELCSSSPFSSRLFLLRSTFIHALLISEKLKPTQHHAIRNHQHGGNHGSPAEGHCRLHSHHQPRRVEGARRTTLSCCRSPVAGKVLRFHYRERRRHVPSRDRARWRSNHLLPRQGQGHVVRAGNRHGPDAAEGAEHFEADRRRPLSRAVHQLIP